MWMKKVTQNIASRLHALLTPIQSGEEESPTNIDTTGAANSIAHNTA